jgi:hypothetical protein
VSTSADYSGADSARVGASDTKPTDDTPAST